MRGLLIAFIFALSGCLHEPAPLQTPSTGEPPDWWGRHVWYMSRDGGVWVTQNPAGANDPTTPDAYAMEWRAVNEGRGLVGRLYGIEAGREATEYWTFREFWHPGERRALIEQWGGPGVYGVGESRWENDEGVLEQTFWLPDGRSWREGHRNRETGELYVTQAFDISESGEWTPSDSREWRRQPVAGEGAAGH